MLEGTIGDLYERWLCDNKTVEGSTKLTDWKGDPWEPSVEW